MSRNTKEVSLIQIRSGNLAEMPKALHQSEFGLAKDANRLFIGNSANTILANRTSEFPYQNLEILTEYSDLRDHFRYSYENNIYKAYDTSVNPPYVEEDRAKLKEFMPIVVTCTTPLDNNSPAEGKLCINSILTEKINIGDSIITIVNKINAISKQTNTYAAILKSTKTYLTFICLGSELIVEDDPSGTPGLVAALGFPPEATYDISMPERKITEKMDDTLHISDFGVKGDRTNYAKEIFNSLIEVYKNFDTDEQFFRNILFPAGVYTFDITDTGNFVPFPMISNLHIHGEGIDRTVIKASDSISGILLDCIDDELNPGTSPSYGAGASGTNIYPHNILIEDVTFDSAKQYICAIRNASNVTFNRVKFKGSTNSSTTDGALVNITGKTSNYASNITFNECIFEGGYCGINVESFAENITITNCRFSNIKTAAIKLGSDTISSEAHIRAVNINGNIITNTPTVTSSNTYAIFVGRNTSFASIYQTQFDQVLFANWTENTYPRPYYVSPESSNNFIDTLNPNTDTRKVLQFNFTQPRWDYITYLMSNKNGNNNGLKVVVVDGLDSDVESSNGLNIKESETELDIRAVGTDASTVKISLENASDLILGSGTSNEEEVTGNIQIEKTLQLNDNEISNELGTDDIKIKTAEDKVILVDNNSETPYEELLSNPATEEREAELQNALTTVAYVKNQVVDTFERIITYKDLQNAVNGEIELINFDPIKYGKNVHLKRIVMNVRTPFYKTYEFIGKATPYVKPASGSSAIYTYYAGDLVSGSTTANENENNPSYAVVINTHFLDKDSDYNFYGNDNLHLVDYDPEQTYTDVKYANIIGKDRILTQSYAEDYFDIRTPAMSYVDIQKNNKFGYNKCEEFVNGGSYLLDEEKLVKYCDRNYLLYDVSDEQSVTYISSDLHNNQSALRKYDEGYCYVFEMDRDVNGGFMDEVNPATDNYSNQTLKLAFYDKDKNKFNSFISDSQLNPGGKLLIRIEFTKEEVLGVSTAQNSGVTEPTEPTEPEEP